LNVDLLATPMKKTTSLYQLKQLALGTEYEKEINTLVVSILTLINQMISLAYFIGDKE